MKFEKLINELKNLNLPKDQYAIFSSGVMAVRGMRDVNDLDVLVKEGLWKELAKRYDAGENRRIEVGEIEFFNGMRPWFGDADELIDSADIIDGIRYVRMDYVLEFKRQMGREKDKADMKMIEDYLK